MLLELALVVILTISNIPDCDPTHAVPTTITLATISTGIMSSGLSFARKNGQIPRPFIMHREPPAEVVSVHPGKGSFRAALTIEGLAISALIFPRYLQRAFSAKCFENVYVFGHLPMICFVYSLI